MTDKEKVFKMFDSPDTSNHYVAWEICKGLGISLNEVFEYMLVRSKGDIDLDYKALHIYFLDFYIRYYITSYNNKLQLNVWKLKNKFIVGGGINFHQHEEKLMQEVIQEIINQLGGELNE